MSKVSFLRADLVPAIFISFGGGRVTRWGKHVDSVPLRRGTGSEWRECWAEGPGMNSGSAGPGGPQLL